MSDKGRSAAITKKNAFMKKLQKHQQFLDEVDKFIDHDMEYEPSTFRFDAFFNAINAAKETNKLLAHHLDTLGS